MENVTKKLYSFSEWVMNLFSLQIYWLLGVLAGGVILGIVPSSIALFASIRKLYNQSRNFNLSKYFIKEYKENFKNSFYIGFWYLLTVLLGYVYSLFLSSTLDSWLVYTHIFIYGILFFVFISTLYLIPVYVHYRIKRKYLVPTTFFILFTSMKWNLPLLLSLLAIALIFIQFSIVFLFFGASLPALIIFYFCLRAFNDYDFKREKA